MLRFTKSVGIAIPAAVSCALLALTSSTSTGYILNAATYELPGLFGYPFSEQNLKDLAAPYITAITGGAPPQPVSVISSTQFPSPADIEPGSVIFGISEGSEYVSDYKNQFNQYWAQNGGTPPNVTFILVGNPYRPNGGNASRVNIGVSPTQTVGTDGITTYDVARQYDPISDAPTNPTNFLAAANGAVGFVLIHLGYASVDMSQAILQDSYGDTNYYLIPTYPVPLLMPLDAIPVIGHPLADLLDPPLRVMIESAYDRTISPGEPTLSDPTYAPDPATLNQNLSLAMSVGMDNLSEDMGQGRPLGTERPGPYGVGGPPVALNPTPDPPVQTLATKEKSTSVVTSEEVTDSDAPASATATTDTADVSSADVPAAKTTTEAASAKKPRIHDHAAIGSATPNHATIHPSFATKIKKVLDGVPHALRPTANGKHAATSAASGDDT